MKVFVLLDRSLDPDQWRAKFDAGLTPDRSPYGYHYGEDHGCEITFSKPLRLPAAIDLFSRAVTRMLGGDLIHALAHARTMFASKIDIIWTHTEREHLAVLLIRKFMPKARRTPVIAQSVWLLDHWPELGWLRRSFFKWLLADAEVLTFHSTSNANLARQLRLNSRIEVVPFGISTASFKRQAPRSLSKPRKCLHVLALGNDMHRDWSTLSAAVANEPRLILRVASSSFPNQHQAPNISAGPLSLDRLRESFAWADLVVIPLHPNLHASGITVLLESVQHGLPLIVSDVGGLRDYFGDEAVTYVPAGDPVALRAAIYASFDRDLSKMARQAQRHLDACSYTSERYAQRHVELSRSILGDDHFSGLRVPTGLYRACRGSERSAAR